MSKYYFENAIDVFARDTIVKYYNNKNITETKDFYCTEYRAERIINYIKNISNIRYIIDSGPVYIDMNDRIIIKLSLQAI